MKVPNNLVSRKQAIKLKNLGFNQPCSWHIMSKLEKSPKPGKRFNCIACGHPIDYNHADYSGFGDGTRYPLTSVPTVYEAIDWIATELKNDNSIFAQDYVGYIYIATNKKDRYAELRKIIDKKLKLLISSRNRSAKINFVKNHSR